MSEDSASKPPSKGEIQIVFATLEQIARDEAFRQHFPAIKRHLINALLLKQLENRLPENPGPDDYEQAGRRAAVYDEVISMVQNLGDYEAIIQTKPKKFPKLRDPNHT